MKKALGIVLVMLALGLVSVPAFAQKAELSLKYWHAGVGGADLWVADYGEYEEPGGVGLTAYGVHQLNGSPVGDYVVGTEKLVLQPGIGRSFILSGSYFLSPSTSVGISYWGLNRTDTVGLEFIDEYDSDVHHLLRVPWWNERFSFMYNCDRWNYAGDGGFDGKGVLAAEGNLSISALDILGAKTLVGSGWEVALSGGIRRAVLNQDQSTALELSGGILTEEGFEYEPWYSEKWNLALDSKLSVSAIGPQVGIEGKYALRDNLILKAGVKAGLLFGTATSDATWTVNHWYYEEGDTVDSYEWFLDESVDVPNSAADPVRIGTCDLSASLGYQITEQWSVEAGYYVSLWNEVPSLYFFDYNDYPSNDPLLYRCSLRKLAWEQPEARNIIVSGLTAGVNFKF